MCKRSIETRCLVGNTSAVFNRATILDVAHEINTVSNNDKDDTHVFCKGKQKISKVFCLYGWVFGVELVHMQKPTDDVGSIFAKLTFHLIHTNHTKCHTVVKQNAKDRGTIEPYLLCRDDGGLQIEQDRIETKLIVTQLVVGGSTKEYVLDLVKIIRIQHLNY